MFCPNCRLNYLENIEFCTRCGVRLVEGTVKDRMRCPYCGVLISSEDSKCLNCGELLNKSDSNKFTALLLLISNIPRELKNFKLDDRFIKTNLLIILGILGIVVIMMLAMNYL
ncbi:MAG: zinc ribbon domain-containing protein [Methanobacteriaceae archaeon]|nr:zinc ribbon domain-containing protein [Methanobacteriaceae archaeon]